jgi:hypothetical protein
MLLLAPALLLLLTAFALAALRMLRPQFRFGWLTAVAMTSAAWIITCLSQSQLPLSQSLPFWRAEAPGAASLQLSAVGLSWPYSLSLVSLVLATLLTAPGREGFPNTTRWAVSMGLAGLGLLALAANDPPTLVLVWAALDLAEVGLLLKALNGVPLSGRAVSVFSVRVVCIALVLLEYVLGSRGGRAADFASVVSGEGWLLLAAAMLRLAVLPVGLVPPSESSLRGGVGTTMQLASAAAGLILLSRIPPGSVASPVATILLLVCAAGGLYSGWMWLRAPDQLTGRAFGILCIASMAVAASLRGNPGGATAWGTALILAGGALFLSSVQHFWLNRAILIGAWSLSSLPFTITATAWNNYSEAPDVILPVFLVAQTLLLAGFIRHAIRPRQAPDTTPARPVGLYAAGIGVLLLGQVFLATWGWSGALQPGVWPAGLAVASMSLVLLWLTPRIPALTPVPDLWLPAAWSKLVSSVEQEGQRVFDGMQRGAGTVAELLEGESGIIWSLLLLVLFVSLIVGRKP